MKLYSSKVLLTFELYDFTCLLLLFVMFCSVVNSNRLKLNINMKLRMAWKNKNIYVTIRGNLYTVQVLPNICFFTLTLQSYASAPPWQSTFITRARLDLRLQLVLVDSWLVCLPSWVGSLLSTGSELVEGTGLELSTTATDLVWCHPPWPGSCQS